MAKKVGVLFNRLDKLAAYERAVLLAGLEPVRISPDDPKPLDGLDGLLLTGGLDVDPAMYGERPRPETDVPMPERDRLEAERLNEALDRDLPVFGICRGLQLFNVARGGSLIQHLENVEEHRVVPVAGSNACAEPAHAVDIVPGTRLAAILGTGHYHVNSRHHQAVGRIGAGLVVAARAGQVVEALEDPSKTFALAVQWHPEDCTHVPSEMRLFEAFRDAVNGR